MNTVDYLTQRLQKINKQIKDLERLREKNRDFSNKIILEDLKKRRLYIKETLYNALYSGIDRSNY